MKRVLFLTVIATAVGFIFGCDKKQPEKHLYTLELLN